MRRLALSLLAACGGSSTPPGPDPIAIANAVSETELSMSIQSLEALDTRYTFGTGDDRAKDYLVGRVQALGLTAELDPFPVGNEIANNIIVKHVGVEAPEVVYIYSAHYDSTSNTPTTLAPGADDNATGVAAVLEAARVMTQHAYKHSIWFVFMAAEEQGSMGSKHMVSWLTQQAIDVRGVIAPDMIGYWPAGDQDELDILGDEDSQGLVDRMADVATRMGVAHKKWIDHNFCYGDDHTSFQEAGFPAITPMDCVEAHNIPNSTEDTPHYHATTDRFETLYMPKTTRVAAVIVATLAELAEPVAK
jgi:leucyl aminopeptidase